MSPPTTGKTLLAGDPDQARAQLEKLSGTLPAEDKAAGERLRAVAVELVRCGLQVTLVDYLEGWQELEAALPQGPHLGPVTVDLDAAGTGCQLAWDQWADISTRDGAGQAAAAVAALLRGVAGCPPLTGPPSLMTPRDPAAMTLEELPGRPAGLPGEPGAGLDPAKGRVRGSSGTGDSPPGCAARSGPAMTGNWNAGSGRTAGSD